MGRQRLEVEAKAKENHEEARCSLPVAKRALDLGISLWEGFCFFDVERHRDAATATVSARTCYKVTGANRVGLAVCKLWVDYRRAYGM